MANIARKPSWRRFRSRREGLGSLGSLQFNSNAPSPRASLSFSCSCQLPNSNPNRSTIQAETEVEVETKVERLKLKLNLNPKLKPMLKLGHVGNWHVCSHFDCNFFSLANSPLERVKFVLAIKSQRQWKTQIKIAVCKNWTKKKKRNTILQIFLTKSLWPK